ncbi:MAG: membrane protein insertion efficiency factor YidD [Rhodospirillaceae bacterium]
MIGRMLPGRMLSTSLVALIRGYQVMVAPMIGPRCRFAPSCSHYTAEAISIHGPGAGLRLGVKRILKCHPWGGAGFDPVPPAFSESHSVRPNQ